MFPECDKCCLNQDLDFRNLEHEENLLSFENDKALEIYLFYYQCVLVWVLMQQHRLSHKLL